MGGKGREEGGGEGVGAPFNFLPPGATDLVTPLLIIIQCNPCNRVFSASRFSGF